MTRQKRRGDDFAEEIHSHLQLEADRLQAEGLNPEDAHAAARKAFGNVTAAEERFHDANARFALDQVWQDLRNAARTMRASPAFTLTAVLTLAVGIGANTAIFSVVNAVLLRPLPYRDAGRLATLWTDDPKHDVHEEGVSYPTFNDWRTMSRSFQDLAYFSRVNPVTLTSVYEPERVESAVVSANFFSVLVSGLNWAGTSHKTTSSVVIASLF